MVVHFIYWCKLVTMSNKYKSENRWFWHRRSRWNEYYKQWLWSLHIYHCSTVADFSLEKYSGSTGHRNSWYMYQQRNFHWGCRWWDSNSQPLGDKPSALAIELTSSKVLLGRSRLYRVGVLNHYHYIFMIAQLWLTSHQRSTVVLLDTGSPGTSREIFSEDANGRVSPSASSLKISLLVKRSSCVQ